MLIRFVFKPFLRLKELNQSCSSFHLTLAITLRLQDKSKLAEYTHVLLFCFDADQAAVHNESASLGVQPPSRHAAGHPVYSKAVLRVPGPVQQSVGDVLHPLRARLHHQESPGFREYLCGDLLGEVHEVGEPYLAALPRDPVCSVRQRRTGPRHSRDNEEIETSE